MKIGVVVLGILGLTGVSGAALAQQVPPARVGFQMDVRTGYSIPMGTLAKGLGEPSPMSDWVTGQVPVIVDIGGKVIPELFIGGYFGLGFGGVAGQLKSVCTADNADCLALTLHLGVEAQYHILPAASANPWIGYGLGFESLALSEKVGGHTSSLGFSGFEFARFMGGVDFRVSREFGIGPFVDLSVAQYSSAHSDTDDSVEIPQKATHEWLTLGVRAVIFP